MEWGAVVELDLCSWWQLYVCAPFAWAATQSSRAVTAKAKQPPYAVVAVHRAVPYALVILSCVLFVHLRVSA